MKHLFLTILLSFACLVQAFEDSSLAVKASQYRQAIREAPVGGDVGTSAELGSVLALRRAERYAHQELWAEAIAEYEASIAGGEDKTAVWIQLSQAWQNKDKDRRARERALQAAYNAYRVAQSPTGQAKALFLLGSLYEKQERPKQAMAAYREGLGLQEHPEYARRYQQLVEATAFRVKGVEVESNSAAPRVCLRFSETLKESKRTLYEDFLVIQPAIKAVVRARAKKLCVEGVRYGESYDFIVRAGLPAASGEKTRTTETFTAQVNDREPTVGFRGSTYILPKTGGQGLPLITVNVASVKLKLLRINDRNLIQQINDRRVNATLDGYDIKTIIGRSGELLWEGEMAISSERNQEVTTAVPTHEILENTKPGIYVVTAEAADKKLARYKDRATQWLVVSDLGLSTFKGSDGLQVFVRSLETALPLADVKLHLYSRNNSELGAVVTDDAGHARFAPGLLRGDGGREPAALMAYGGHGDFNFLDLTRPTFDLSDRGVAGREAPGPVDVFLYTERGVYRPGEAVELMALMRDSRGYALEDLPLILKVIRPDGVEVDQLTVTEQWLGGFYARLPLARNARTGTWKVQAYGDPQAKPVGQIAFQVEDFVPQRLKLDLKTQAEVIEPSKAVEVGVTGRFLYGAPAANLKVAAELVLQEDPDPYPDYIGYRFGLVQESWKAKRFNLAVASTDADGKTRTTVKLDEIPDTSRLLRALVRVSLFEPGGRPVNRSLALPYRPQPFAIGIRPRFEDGIKIGEEAGFEVIAVDNSGQQQAVSGLRYELFREDYNYYWYYRNNRWNYKLIIRDSDPVAGGDLMLAADRPYRLTQAGLDWGRYRLEIYDSTTGIASSMRFQVGWFVSPGTEEAPDQLQVTLDKPSYRAGETAQVYVKAPFAGEVLLTVAGDRMWTTRNFTLSTDGTTVELPVSEEWGPGVYLTATAFRPARNGSQRGPGRAIGVVWLGLNPEIRTLGVTLETPDELTPRQTFALPVRVEGVKPGEPAYLTVAAVDEGILQLTDFRTPDPLQHFLGKRRLGVELLDIYGKLIEAGGLPGRLRTGGDGDSRQLDASNVRTVKTVALFSGPVVLDDQGQARISLELPDFNGELRLMAIAWDRNRLGRAEAPLLVRDPLVAQVYLPRFLAPDDTAQLTLDVQNLSTPVGDYLVWLTTKGAVALEGSEVGFTFQVQDTSAQNSKRGVYLLRGLRPGVGQIQLQMDGPAGFTLTREWEISVRPAQPIVTERFALRLPSTGTLSAGKDLIQPYMAGTGEVQLSFSTRPNLDVPGLLGQLSRYPYGCVEQTTSRALPLLYFNRVARTWVGEAATEAGLRTQIQKAIQHILTMQRYGGGFGLWNPDSPAERWLSAYAMDFLSRARREGYLVPDYSYRQGLQWLEKRAAGSSFEPPELAAQAYALYVLAGEQRARIGDLRYLHDNYLNKLPTRLAQAQLGAALARYGDLARAREAFTKALPTASRREGLRDYGTGLRDRAALLALLAEADIMADEIPQLAEELAADLQQRRYTSTQEKAWLLLAAHALLADQGPLRLTVDGETVPPDSSPFYLTPTSEALEQGVKIVNQGEQSVWYVVNTSGVPVEIQPPERKGFAITRRFYTRAGKAVDPAQVQQNELLVAVITGEALTEENHQALIVDLLPAGLEIENARLAHNESADELNWLPELSNTLNVEFRDDRFVAALDLNWVNKREPRQFAVAYLVRAVTPGTYKLPAVFVEDMYKPWYNARGAMDTLKIE